MKIYLAGSWLKRSKLQRHAKLLQKDGFDITSRWLFGHEGLASRVASQEDLEDIESADIVVSFTLKPDSGYMSGGRHVEFGYGYAKGKKMIVVGPRENVFHYLDNVEQFDDLDNARSYLKALLIMLQPV